MTREVNSLASNFFRASVFGFQTDPPTEMPEHGIKMIDRVSVDSWHINIAPSRKSALLAVALAWIFGLMVFALVYFYGESKSLGFATLISFGFPTVISYYGLKSAFLGAGRVSLDSDGFSIARGISDERHAWADVQRFYVDRFGASPVYEGRLVPHFRLKNGEVGWLPNNLGFNGPQLVTAMERMRQLAEHDWPYRPNSITDALRNDYGTVIEARRPAPPKRDKTAKN